MKRKVPKFLSVRQIISLAPYFWGKVKRTKRCWEWQGARDEYGYGKINIGRRLMRCHRVSWQYFNPPHKRGQVLCHKCDNPPCVNPNHLYAGTQADNNRDRDMRSKQKNRKLSFAKVAQIRKLKGLVSQLKLSERFGVSPSLISNIHTNKKWRHIV